MATLRDKRFTSREIVCDPNNHVKCKEIAIKCNRNEGIYIKNLKRCTHCNIYTNDKICPESRCPCCNRLFKINHRWKSQSVFYPENGTKE